MNKIDKKDKKPTTGINQPDFTAALLKMLIEQKEIIETLQANEKHYRSIIHNISEGFIAIDRDGNIVFWNKAAEKIFGFKKREVIGSPLTVIIPERYRKEHLRSFNRAVETGKSKILGKTVQIYGLRKNNEEIVLELSLAREKTPGNVHFNAIVKDITLRKKAEKQVEESERKFRSLFLESKDAIYFSSGDGKFLDINPAGVELLGYSSKEEVLNLDISKDIYLNNRDRLKFKEVMQELGYVKDMEVKLRKKDGSIITALVTSSSFKTLKEDSIAYMGIFRDISKRVSYERQLVKMNKELLEANDKLKQAQVTLFHHGRMSAVGQLAAGMAHEINNPMAFVASNLSSLAKYFNSFKSYQKELEKMIGELAESKKDNAVETAAYTGEPGKRIAEFRKKFKIDFINDDLESIFEESTSGFERITKIIESLRNFSRIDKEDKIEHYDLNRAVQDTLAMIRNEIEQTADVKTVLADIPLLECRGVEINQVLLNIIMNAVQAIQFRERGEKGEITIKTYLKDQYVCCEVADNGPGIPNNVKSRIFEPFFSTKDMGSGVGLGLNVCHYIVALKHKGDLFFKTEVGKGSTFYILLPYKNNIKTYKVKSDTDKNYHG